MTGVPGWPARLVDGDLVLRPLGYGDAGAWGRLRGRNADWLQPWEATPPPGADARPSSFRQLVRQLRGQARQGLVMPFAVEVGGEFAGQLTVSNIVRGSALTASVGYWLGREYAGRGLMPCAVAVCIDHCFRSAGLHRIEIAIRPENTNSLRVVEKLGLREVGYFPRYLHIDGDWRDHRIFAVTVEECPGGLRARLDAPSTGPSPH